MPCWKWRGTDYEISVANPHGLSSGRIVLKVDGKPYLGDTLLPTTNKRCRVQATIVISQNEPVLA